MSALEEALWQLLPSLSGLPKRQRWQRLLLVMQAYIDDSTEPPVFLLAGFVARAKQFAELTGKWADALAKPPRLEYFKMKEAFSRTGQFDGWSISDRDTRLADLVSIIKQHVLVGVSSVVRQDDFHAVMRGRIAKPLDSPYWLMYHSVMSRVFEWEIETGLNEKVDFIFDEQLHQSDEVQAHFGLFLEFAPPRVKELLGERPVHRNDKTALPLQSADMLAWHLHRYRCEEEKGSAFSSPTMRVLNTIPQIDSLWTRERLQALAVECEERNRLSGMYSLYENQRAERNLPDAISGINLRLIARTRSHSSAVLSPFPVNGMRRFRLVDSCPLSRNPHLHRRRGNECLSESPISDLAADSEPQQ